MGKERVEVFTYPNGSVRVKCDISFRDPRKASAFRRIVGQFNSIASRLEVKREKLGRAL